MDIDPWALAGEEPTVFRGSMLYVSFAGRSGVPSEASEAKVMVCILRITRCCLWCLEKFIKFINKSPGPHRPVGDVSRRVSGVFLLYLVRVLGMSRLKESGPQRRLPMDAYGKNPARMPF